MAPRLLGHQEQKPSAEESKMEQLEEEEESREGVGLEEPKGTFPFLNVEL